MNKFSNLIASALIICGFLSCSVPVEREITAIKSAKNLDSLVAGVACAYPDAARIGSEILEMGGNAIDASVAVQWALAVCYPRAGNIGGGGFMVLRLADGTATALDFREMASLSATENIFLDSEGNVMTGKSTETANASGVPGTVRGLYEAHAKYGKLPMETLIQPAINMARKGYVLTETEADKLNENKAVFLHRNDSQTPFTRKEFWKSGDTLVQNDLANTLERIRNNGPDEFYTGQTAEKIVAQMNGCAGCIDASDLASYRAVWREPVIMNFDSYKLISMAPPSSGGIAVGQLLTMYFDCIKEPLEHNSPDYIHALVEMQRRVYADRSEHLGDPDFWDVPQDDLLDTLYLRSRMDNFIWHQATPSLSIAPGQFAMQYESMETTHLSVVDAEGNAVSVTTTLNDNYGSKIVVNGAGFILNNEMDDFSSKPGEPNMFGLVGGKANSVEPGKRMLSSMTPVIVEKNGKLFLVAGSPGGSTIITSVFQTIMNTAVFDLRLAEAIAAPKFHSQWLPDQIFFEEGRFPSEVMGELENRNHKIVEIPTLGRVDAILANGDGTYQISGDPRGDNTASGYK
jgi:gamma-glutamyltranspeptidase/glutathione hydrolase